MTPSERFAVGDQVTITGPTNDFVGDSGCILRPAHPDSPWDWVVGHIREDWATAVREDEITELDLTTHVPTCECGHTSGDHVTVKRPGQGALHGVCYVPGCGCREFREAEPAVPADSGREAA